MISRHKTKRRLLVKVQLLTSATPFAVVLSEAIVALVAPSVGVKMDLLGQTMMTPGPDTQQYTDGDNPY